MAPVSNLISSAAILDRPEAEEAQADLLGGLRPGRLRLRTLLMMRWVAVAGQGITLLVVSHGLGFPVPALCWALLVVTALGNLAVIAVTNRQRLASEKEAACHIGVDIVQLVAMLYLTGGSLNSFQIMLLAPVALASVTLPGLYVILLTALATAGGTLIAFVSLPLPSADMVPFNPPTLNRAAGIIARTMTFGFVAGYGYLASRERRRMELALNVTRSVLAREQRLSSLGALAAAAAHELGTPLATIQVIARELEHSAKDEYVKEDAQLLLSQAERCREILKRLTETPETRDSVFDRMSLLQLVQEAIKPHHGPHRGRDERVRVEAVVTGTADATPPDIWRRPEILHAMTSIIDNATDFAKAEVLVTARFDADHVAIEVTDDGPGFAPELIGKLGEPYVSTRPTAGAGHSDYIGMGLGFFIAKTLLEKTGAKVAFYNGNGGGAVVSARWPRAAIEATDLAEDGSSNMFTSASP